MIKGLNKFAIPVKIPYPQLWWPRGMGYPNFYYFSFSLDKRPKPKRRDFGTSVATGFSYSVCKIKLVNTTEKGFYFEVEVDQEKLNKK